MANKLILIAASALLCLGAAQGAGYLKFTGGASFARKLKVTSKESCAAGRFCATSGGCEGDYCAKSDTKALTTSACWCGASYQSERYCMPGQFCWEDNSCQLTAKPKVCDESDTVPVSASFSGCVCADEGTKFAPLVTAGNFCWKGRVATDKYGAINYKKTAACTPSDTVAVAADCACSASSIAEFYPDATKAKGHYCWVGGIVSTIAKPTSCAHNDTKALTGAACRCAETAKTAECVSTPASNGTARVDRYCWDQVYDSTLGTNAGLFAPKTGKHLCMTAPKPSKICSNSRTVGVAEDCACSFPDWNARMSTTLDCKKGSYCYSISTTGQGRGLPRTCSATKPVDPAPACTQFDKTKLTAKCTCETKAECAVGQYCFKGLGTCVNSARVADACTLSDTTATTKDCSCATGGTSVDVTAAGPNKFCYVRGTVGAKALYTDCPRSDETVEALGAACRCETGAADATGSMLGNDNDAAAASIFGQNNIDTTGWCAKNKNAGFVCGHPAAAMFCQKSCATEFKAQGGNPDAPMDYDKTTTWAAVPQMNFAGGNINPLSFILKVKKVYVNTCADVGNSELCEIWWIAQSLCQKTCAGYGNLNANSCPAKSFCYADKAYKYPCQPHPEPSDACKINAATTDTCMCGRDDGSGPYDPAALNGASQPFAATLSVVSIAVAMAALR